MIFEIFGPIPECPSDFGSFGKNFAWWNTLRSWVLGQPKFFSESRLKLHGEVWAKTHLETDFQPISKSFDQASEAPTRANSDHTWGPSEPPWRGQMTSELAENWCPGRIWPKLHRGVWGGNPKKIWAGLDCAVSIVNEGCSFTIQIIN